VEIKASLDNTYCEFSADEDLTDVMDKVGGMYEGFH